MLIATLHKQALGSLAATMGFVWVGCVVYTLLQHITGVLTVPDFAVSPLGFLFALTFFFWLPWALFAPLVAVCSAYFPIRPHNWAPALAAHIVLLLSVALVHGAGIGVLDHYSEADMPEVSAFQPWQHAGHFLFGEDMLLFDAVVYAVFAATLNIRNFHQIVRRQELDAAKLNEHLAELRLEALRMQVNPHYLFNALNAIAVLIRKGEAERAEKAVMLLSRFFRHTLETSDRHWAPLEEELEIVRQYIEIAKIRFGDRLRVDECCDSTVRRAVVPTMLLQPLVENAFVHGFADKVGPCELRLECRAAGDRLEIAVRDNGIGAIFYSDPDFEEGVGLANVRGRLEQMYAGDYVFDVRGAPGEGTWIRMALPLSPADSRIAV